MLSAFSFQHPDAFFHQIMSFFLLTTVIKTYSNHRIALHLMQKYENMKCFWKHRILFMLISHLNDSTVWLSDEVPVSLSLPTLEKGVDFHVGPGLSFWVGFPFPWQFTWDYRVCQGVFHCPDVVIDGHLIKNRHEGR